MAIDDLNSIDGMAFDESRKALCLLLTDHLAWSGKNTLSEYDHLILLQKKLNAYLSYLETKQYEERFSEEITMAVIEIHFKYEITENCEKFLNAVQSQVGQYGVMLEAHIGE